MPPSDDASLRQRRLAVVRTHMESENELDFATTLATFDHPRYELVATGKVFDGADEVAGYYRSSRAAVPDQRNENAVLTYAEDAVVAEFDLLGTVGGNAVGGNAAGGDADGGAPTGRTFRCRMCAVFLFPPGGDRIIGERVYFDQGTIDRQVAGDPARE